MTIDSVGYVRSASETIGVQIAPDDEGAVVAMFANLARAAAFLNAFPLSEAVEPAATFTAFDDGAQ
jgi:Protein of unknown function (DUF4089)